ncbi:hypothetical protein [Streptomyces sp. NBC_01455]|uniref:hypothetical protein n=1 Tax=Streptomyces sp. NBC_01455 TaxID=2903874 RepID=UPI002E30DF2D|nr:hypothetical protein [Streptomyces sp. NBC_01455]
MRMVQEPLRADITDAVVKEAYTGPALLRSFAHVLAPPADLPGLEAVSAGHLLTDPALAPVELTDPALAPVEPVCDHLKEDAQ